MADAFSEKTIKELVRIGEITGDPVTSLETPYAVIPNDCQVVDLSKFVYNQFAAKPHRKIATVSVLDAASFIEYYQLFSDVNSRVFADETKAHVLAILDYHGAGNDGSARWGQHRVSLGLRKSPEWSVWIGSNGQANKMSQSDFAEFVEDNGPDVVQPSAATMLEMARSLEAKVDVDFQSSIRTANGNVQFTYNENVKGTFGSGKIEIPEQFTIAIPVYVGTARVPLTARLRYRINGGKLVIWYDLLRASVIERDVFLAVLGGIQDGLKIGIINGAPS